MKTNLPSFSGNFRRITYFLTSSFFVRLNNLRILDARLGPKRRGTVVSVRPGISCSPEIVLNEISTSNFEADPEYFRENFQFLALNKVTQQRWDILPFFTMINARADKLASTIHPRTDFRLRSPSRRAR